MVFEAELNKAYGHVKQYVINNKGELALIGAIIIGWAGYQGYTWWQRGGSMNAQLAFADAYEAYQRALQLEHAKDAKSADRKELWEQVEGDARHGAKRYKHSAYGPYFKALVAQSLAHQGNRDAAIVAMREAVGAMGKKDAYRGLYDVTLALMLLDGTNEQQTEGLQLLNTLADTAGGYQDMALYYSGLWYQTHNELDKALSYWRRITQSEHAATYDQARSPWRELVEPYLS